ncbi:uncharacterized protein LOC141731906 isoform X1 [Zonotrichia albicollis]|uniref:uncharacterized protein LOC141731906 isoform X1 n=1 Tax=Zonotrichia albicollis TaxID=44394 RepID=UPI003D80E123
MPQTHPKSPQDPPKMPQIHPKSPLSPPNLPQIHLKPPQDPPKPPQDPPKSPQDPEEPPPKTGLEPPGEEPQALARRLFRLDGVRKSQVAAFLRKDTEFSAQVAREYLELFQFQGLSLEQALRQFLRALVLSGETQERERVLGHFSRRFHRCNPGAFPSAAPGPGHEQLRVRDQPERADGRAGLPPGAAQGSVRFHPQPETGMGDGRRGRARFPKDQKSPEIPKSRNSPGIPGGPRPRPQGGPGQEGPGRERRQKGSVGPAGLEALPGRAPGAPPGAAQGPPRGPRGAVGAPARACAATPPVQQTAPRVPAAHRGPERVPLPGTERPGALPVGVWHQRGRRPVLGAPVPGGRGVPAPLREAHPALGAQQVYPGAAAGPAASLVGDSDVPAAGAPAAPARGTGTGAGGAPGTRGLPAAGAPALPHLRAGAGGVAGRGQRRQRRPRRQRQRRASPGARAAHQVPLEPLAGDRATPGPRAAPHLGAQGHARHCPQAPPGPRVTPWECHQCHCDCHQCPQGHCHISERRATRVIVTKCHQDRV